MPIKPYEFTKSADIIAQSQEQIQQMRMSNDPNIQKMAHNQQFLDAIFKLPEIRKAQKLEGVMSTAAGLVKEKDESEFDYQIRQQEYIRSAAAELDPNVSIQANDELIRLMSQKFEQSRLKARADVEDKDTEEKLFLAAQEKVPVLFKSTATGMVPVKTFPPGTERTDPMVLAALEAAGPGHDLGSGLDVLKLESRGLGTGEKKVLGLGDKSKYIADINAQTDMLGGLSGVSKILQDSPLTLSSIGETIAGGGDIVNSMEQVYTTFLGRAADVKSGQTSLFELAQENQFKIDTGIANSEFLRTLREQGALDSTARAMITDLAYRLAKSLDPGGRLSDQDVTMAIRMLTGNGDPNAILDLFRERMAASRARIATARDYAAAGHLDGYIGQNTVKRFDEAYAAAEAELVALAESLENKNILYDRWQNRDQGDQPSASNQRVITTSNGQKITVTLKN